MLSMWRGAVPELRAAGVKIFDLSQIFAKVKDTVYVDPCCHVNDLGQRLLADAMAERIAEPLRKKLSARK